MTGNLTEGSPGKLLLLFALPLMAGNVCQQLYTVVDTAVVGTVLGVEALAALGAVDWLNWMVLTMVQGFAQGFAILMAQRYGAGEYGKLRQVVANSIFLSVLCAVFMTAVSEVMAQPVLMLLHTPAGILPTALSYLRILFAGVPAVMACNLGSSILRALGDSRTPLAAMLVSSAVNILLDLVFVVGLGTGVEGAAAATVIAQLLSAGYCFRKIRKIELLRLTRQDWHLERQLLQRLMLLGTPVAFQNTVISVGGLIVQRVVNEAGVAFLAGFTATNKMYGLLEIAATSYGYAMVTYAGQNLGAGKLRRISRGMRAEFWISMGTSVLITCFMLLFGRGILSCFISADASVGEEALEIAFRYLKLMSLFLPVLYVLHMTRSCIQGLGNTVLPMVSGVAEFIMRTGAVLLLPRWLGESGIFYAEILAWTGAVLLLVPGYFLTMKRITAA